MRRGPRARAAAARAPAPPRAPARSPSLQLCTPARAPVRGRGRPPRDKINRHVRENKFLLLPRIFMLTTYHDVTRLLVFSRGKLTITRERKAEGRDMPSVLVHWAVSLHVVTE